MTSVWETRATAALVDKDREDETHGQPKLGEAMADVLERPHRGRSHRRARSIEPKRRNPRRRGLRDPLTSKNREDRPRDRRRNAEPDEGPAHDGPRPSRRAGVRITPDDEDSDPSRNGESSEDQKPDTRCKHGGTLALERRRRRRLLGGRRLAGTRPESLSVVGAHLDGALSAGARARDLLACDAIGLRRWREKTGGASEEERNRHLHHGARIPQASEVHNDLGSVANANRGSEPLQSFSPMHTGLDRPPHSSRRRSSSVNAGIPRFASGDVPSTFRVCARIL